MHHRLKNLVVGLLGLLILVGGVLTTYFLLQGPEPYRPLILDAVEIRTIGNNSVAKARIIDDMDKNIGRVEEQEILDKWDELTNCLHAGCSDDALFDFILTIVISRPEEVPQAKLLADVIVAGRFWGSNDVLKFSKAVTAANEAISQVNAKEIDKKWDEIVACDGKCQEKNDLVFDEIGLILVKGTTS